MLIFKVHKRPQHENVSEKLDKPNVVILRPCPLTKEFRKEFSLNQKV